MLYFRHWYNIKWCWTFDHITALIFSWTPDFDTALNDYKLPIIISSHTNAFFVAAIAQEKTEEELKSGIEQFDKDQLRPQKTEEKNPLPDKDGRLPSLT